jgi:hypothetical protein
MTAKTKRQRRTWASRAAECRSEAGFKALADDGKGKIQLPAHAQFIKTLKEVKIKEGFVRVRLKLQLDNIYNQAK